MMAAFAMDLYINQLRGHRQVCNTQSALAMAYVLWRYRSLVVCALAWMVFLSWVASFMPDIAGKLGVHWLCAGSQNKQVCRLENALRGGVKMPSVCF